MLYNIIILPIETIIDWVFTFCFNKLSSFGIISCIIGVSIVINFLALPIYNLADKLQLKERETANRLSPYVKRIKTAFKGDEQFMMIQTYYRQNHYHPLYALRSSLSILIEIPFFIAAYHYLSHCDKLFGATFWIFKNLAKPDNLFSFSLFNHIIYINILPVLMTLINIISGIVYSKEAPLREKIQIYVLALIFLCLLYNSPSGLVIYWILNNLFSLVKNIVLKTKNPKIIPYIFLAVLFTLFTLYFWFYQPDTSIWKKELITVFTILFIAAPFIISLLKKLFKKQILYIENQVNNTDSKIHFSIFILSALSLSLLYGLYLPSSVISSSPIEFSFLGSIDSPLYYVKTSFYMFFGLFVFWPACIYFMFSKKIKNYMPFIFVALLFFSIGNIFIFKPKYGNLSPTFEFTDNSFFYDIPKYYTLASALTILLSLLLYFILIRLKKSFILSVFLSSILVAETSYSFYRIAGIKSIFNSYKNQRTVKTAITDKHSIEPVFHLTKEGKNILVFFLDRAVSSFFPSFVEQFPQLKDQFKGFDYFPNTLSYGRNTMNGFPPIMGGYEYTPDNINKRKNELLKDKHNEALKVMPKLFSDANFSVSIANPSMANYSWANDISIYSDIPNVSAINIDGDYSDLYKKEKNIFNLGQDEGILCNKQIKNFSILQGLFPPLRIIFYNTIKSDTSLAESFIDNISTLYYLDKIFDFTNTKDSFVYLGNDAPHEPIFLDSSFEKPSEPDWSTSGNYDCYDTTVLQDYNVNAASIIQLGRFFEYLQENNVYDNSRIIIVSDHGYVHHYSAFNNFNDATIPSSYNALLLFKDFNSSDSITINNTFMTNADTLYLLKQELNISNINPYTGNELIADSKDSVKVFPLDPDKGNNPTYNINETQFRFINPCWEINDDIFNPENWKAFNYSIE